MPNLQHNQNQSMRVLAAQAQHHWRMFTVLLLILCLGIQPITATIACLTPGTFWQNTSFAASQRAELAKQPNIKLIQTHAPTPTGDPACWFITSSAPRDAMAYSFGPDRLLIVLGMLLLGAHLLQQYLPTQRLLLVPQLRYPPPTPPPIA